MKTQNHVQETIIKNVLSSTITTTGWILCALLEVGGITVQTFLSPSLYADFPNVGEIFFDEKKPGSKKKVSFKKMTIRQSLRRLENYGFIERKESKYELTMKGAKLVRYILNIKKSQKKLWDKKYRVVIFDIPEKKRRVRDWLRQELNLLGYQKLQNSVFIGKLPLPSEVIEEIKKEKISNCVNYLLVDKVYKNII